MSELEKLRGREFRGVEELVAAASNLVEQYTNELASGNARLGITQRITRHYLSEGLLGLPTGHSGPTILFNYGNLLRLLAVKKLLADGWSVIKVRELMSALDIIALEQLVITALISPTPKKKSEANRGHESVQGFKNTQRLPSGVISPQAPQRSLVTAPPPASLAIESARRAERASAEWIELATGLEIKIRRSFRPPRNEQEREQLVARFWSVVNGKPGEK